MKPPPVESVIISEVAGVPYGESFRDVNRACTEFLRQRVPGYAREADANSARSATIQANARKRR